MLKEACFAGRHKNSKRNNAPGTEHFGARGVQLVKKPERLVVIANQPC